MSSRNLRPALTGILAVLAAVALAACGSSSSSSPSSSSSAKTSTPAKTGGTISFVFPVAWQSLDPGLDYTTEGTEINWVVYTGLTTYAHANGTAGTKLIPGLCTTLPVVTDAGKTYTCTLRKGLVFSNGKPVLASDFTYTVERSIKIPWGGSGEFITPNIVGATAFANGKAKTISGITTDNATGQIVIHLTTPYGAFSNVLAFPSLGLVYPPDAPFKVEATNPPPGVGPYKVTDIVANQSFTAIPNPYWAKEAIPGIPSAKVTVDAKIDPNNDADALSVLNNTTDVFDWAATIPGSLLPQIKATAANRFRFVDLGGSTYYFFLSTYDKPFNNFLARKAVAVGINELALQRLGAGTLLPACYFLPPYVPGHVSAPCEYGETPAGNVTEAKALIKQAGLTGYPVTVWGENISPRLQWATYYASFLDSIGLKATLKTLSPSVYWTTLGDLSLHPQTGFADWNMDFPNPVDFYGVLLDGNSIEKTDNENFGETNDPAINAEVSKLAPTPTPDLSSVASDWQTLDKYVASKAYAVPFGYQTFPEFVSDRINYSALVFQPEYGWDWTSFELK